MATDRPVQQSTYVSRTMLVLAALGFCGGLPNVLATSVVPVWVTEAGWSLQAIGLVTLLGFPYALKFMWAPLVDRVRLPWSRALGQRRAWLLFAQAGAACTILLLAWVGPGTDDAARDQAFMGVLVVMVLFSATQDIVADAYRTEVLTPREYGSGAAMFVSGYRIVFVVVGALVLQYAAVIGWPLAVAGVGGLALIGLVVPCAAREPVQSPTAVGGARAPMSSAFVEPFTELWRAWGVRLVALGLFVLLFRLPDQLGNAMTPPLLLRGLGFSADEVGWVRQGLGFTLTIAGALAGGWVVGRVGLMRCLWIFGALQALSNAGFLVLAEVYGATVSARATEGATPLYALVPVIAIESFAGGLVTAGFVAFLMSVCSRGQVATQYALLTALMAASNALGGGLSGWMANELDYDGFFLLTVALGAPGLALIAFVRPPARIPSRPHGSPDE